MITPSSITVGLRKGLEPLTRTKPHDAHAGLWLDRFLTQQTIADHYALLGLDEDSAKLAKAEAEYAKISLVGQVVNKQLPRYYMNAFTSWAESFPASDPRVLCAKADSSGRVLIGTGQKGPAEFGISLHHTWGTPILPGSSLKGIASLGADRYFQDEQWRRRDNAAQIRKGAPNAFDALFGDVEERGAVIFHDAWLVPPQNGTNGLHADVLTVHHPNYYQDRSKAPSDFDDPTPVAFISAHGTFLIVLELSPDLDPDTHGHWLQAAWEALRLGLAHHGIGAKTNAGYGRIDLPRYSATDQAQHRQQENQDPTLSEFHDWLRVRSEDLARPDSDPAKLSQRAVIDGIRADWLSRLRAMSANDRKQAADAAGRLLTSKKLKDEKANLRSDILA